MTETAETKASRHPGRGVGALGTGVGSGMAQGIRGQMQRVGDVLRRSFGSKEEAPGKPGGMWFPFTSRNGSSPADRPMPKLSAYISQFLRVGFDSWEFVVDHLDWGSRL